MGVSSTRSSATEPAAGTRVLVVGFGNTLRGDDGAGPAVVAGLARRLPPDWVADDLVRLVTRQQLVPELSLDLSDSTSAIFVDAAVDLRPGQVHCAAVRRAPDLGGAAGLHTLTPAGLLAMTKAMCGTVPDAQLWSIGVADLDYRDGLSPIVSRAVADVVDHVVARIVSLIEQPPSTSTSSTGRLLTPEVGRA